MLPFHLRTLAKVEGSEVDVAVDGISADGGQVTLGAVLDAVEQAFPVLEGTFREHGRGKRRAFVRFFACQQDLSHEAMELELPEAVAAGREPLMIVGAMAGG